MSGLTYCVSIPYTQVSTAGDILELYPADDHPIELISLELFQRNDITANERLKVRIAKGMTVGSGGTSETPAPVNHAGTASFTAKSFNTTDATGTPKTLGTYPLSWLQNIARFYPDDMKPKCGQGENSIVITLVDAPTAAIYFWGNAIVKEL